MNEIKDFLHGVVVGLFMGLALAGAIALALMKAHIITLH